MALLRSITSYAVHPYFAGADQVFCAHIDKICKIYHDVLQTSGSGATMGNFNIIQTATVSNEFILTSLNLSLLSAGLARADIYLATTKICTLPTTTANVGMDRGYCFASGIVGGTTTQATVSVVINAATASCHFFAAGYRQRIEVE